MGDHQEGVHLPHGGGGSDHRHLFRSGGAAAENGGDNFFMTNESLSAIENMGRMGVPLPEPLKAALEKIHGKDEVKLRRRTPQQSWRGMQGAAAGQSKSMRFICLYPSFSSEVPCCSM